MCIYTHMHTHTHTYIYIPFSLSIHSSLETKVIVQTKFLCSTHSEVKKTEKSEFWSRERYIARLMEDDFTKKTLIIWKRMDMCICITESLWWTSEINTTLQINYTSVKKKKSQGRKTGGSCFICTNSLWVSEKNFKCIYIWGSLQGV